MFTNISPLFHSSFLLPFSPLVSSIPPPSSILSPLVSSILPLSSFVTAPQSPPRQVTVTRNTTRNNAQIHLTWKQVTSLYTSNLKYTYHLVVFVCYQMSFHSPIRLHHMMSDITQLIPVLK